MTPVRVWWALPTLAVASAAIVMGVVVGPTVGEHVTIPRELAVPAASSSTPSAEPLRTIRQPGVSRPKPKPATVASPTPESSPPEQTHVVAPRRPVVRASSDDNHEQEASSSESETGDR